MTRVSDLQPAVCKEIVDVTAEPFVRERLLEFGVAPGRLLRVLRKLPFSGPVIVQVGTLFIALRREEADQVWVS